VLDCVLFNAGAALVAAGRASTIPDGVDAARAVVTKGDAVAALDRLIAICAAL
jgi:anthranilate phosphoribosyltransferase